MLEANPDLIQIRQPYQANLFVNRQNEIDAIYNHIQRAQSEPVIPESIINYWGVGVIGKTWILRHLKDKFSYQLSAQEKYPSFTVFFDFENYNAGNLLRDFTKEIAKQVDNELKSGLPSLIRERLEATKMSGNLDELVDAIFHLIKNFTPLILLGNADQVSTELWEQVKKIFLEPIVSTGRVLIIVAGRRQVPRWRRFEVGRRVMESDKSQIGPFDKQGVFKQLERLDTSISADLLYPYTAGNSQIVDTFVRYIQLLTEESKKRL